MESKIIELLKRKLDIRTNQHGRLVLDGQNDIVKDAIEAAELRMIDAELELLREEEKQHPLLSVTCPTPLPVTEEERNSIEQELERWSKEDRRLIDLSPTRIRYYKIEKRGEKKILETRELDEVYEEKDIGNSLKPRVIERCKINVKCVMFNNHDGDCNDILGTKLGML
jgi:plasmid stability protein